MIKLIIFDWDDVFTRGSIDGYYACYRAALAGVGVRLDPAEEDRRIKAKWGAGHRPQLEYLLREHPELVDKAVKIFEDEWFGDTFVDHLALMPGAQEFLTRLAKRYKLAVATGGHPRVLLDRVFPKFRIPAVFSQVLTIYDTPDTPAKPDPFMLQKILKDQHIQPDEAIFVGDAASDMQMAWNAGVEPVAVLTGHLDRKQAEDLGVKHIIDNVTALEPELEKIASN